MASREELCCRGLLDPADCASAYTRTNPNHMCDSIIYNYCKTSDGEYDELCACINSTIPSPDCFDLRCRGSGAFLPTNMIKQPCPAVLNCNQYITLGENAKNNVVNATQYQTCGINAENELVETNQVVASEPVPSGTKSGDVPKALEEEQEKQEDPGDKRLYYAIGVIVVVIVLYGGYKGLRKKK
jgi:hypothetical protein